MVVALDDDDPQPRPSDSEKVIVSISKREDSLGEKYNRCRRLHEAEIYVLGCDDTVITTPGWDEMLLKASRIFEDGLAIVYFGEIPGVFQPGCAVSHKLAEKIGFLCPPYFPFWWSETWLDEIGRMVGCIVKTNVDIEPIGPLKETRGARDITFWARFFDETRPLRRKVADKIIAERLNALAGAFELRNSCLRDAAYAAQFEGYDAPEDQRYLRLKVAAEQMLGE